MVLIGESEQNLMSFIQKNRVQSQIFGESTEFSDQQNDYFLRNAPFLLTGSCLIIIALRMKIKH